MTRDWNGDLAEVLEFAIAAHEGQTDKAGKPYIYHPIRVALLLTDPVHKAIGLLHDVVEDTPVTIEEIAEKFGDRIAVGVDAISRRKHVKGVPDETHDEYYARVLCNEDAIQVKIADATDNLNPTRLHYLPQDMQDRLVKKYLHALDVMYGRTSVRRGAKWFYRKFGSGAEEVVA